MHIIIILCDMIGKRDLSDKLSKKNYYWSHYVKLL